jgi:hypothetical protein
MLDQSPTVDGPRRDRPHEIDERGAVQAWRVLGHNRVDDLLDHGAVALPGALPIHAWIAEDSRWAAGIDAAELAAPCA